MAFDKEYYIEKKIKLEEKLGKRKDRFINNVIQEANTLLTDQTDIQTEYTEVLKALQENAPELFKTIETPEAKAEGEDASVEEKKTEEKEPSKGSDKKPVDVPKGK